MNQVDREKRACALELAIASGAVESCRLHENVLLDHWQLDAALEFGSEQFDAGQLSGVFDDKGDMENHIRRIVGEAAESCYECDRHN
ncbi:hypothetical protein D3C77_474720 [compost metagenome]